MYAESEIGLDANFNKFYLINFVLILSLFGYKFIGIDLYDNFINVALKNCSNFFQEHK